MIQPKIIFCVIVLLIGVIPIEAYSQQNDEQGMNQNGIDSLKKILTKDPADTIKANTAYLNGLKRAPYLSVQQYVKGMSSGFYVAEPSGEPGTQSLMFVRGLSTPLFMQKDVYNSQPVVFIDGIPLAQETGFTLNIGKYDFYKIGTGTNMLAAFDINNIESLEVLKSPIELAGVGPLATNGAISLKTRRARPRGIRFNVESYLGILQRPEAFTTNSNYESEFRERYYAKFGTPVLSENKPIFIKNTNDPNFYSSSDWDETYYKSKPVHHIGFGLNGGSARANFLFNASNTNSKNFDATGFNRFNLLFGINMLPFDWLSVSSSINASRMDRDRNRGLRDRYAETRYIPDLTNPLSPRKEAYDAFLGRYASALDNNKNYSIVGAFNAVATFGKLRVKTLLSVDYEEASREVFWGKDLMDGNNFNSYFFGYNQRVHNINSADYTISNGDHKLVLEAGQSLTSDVNKYDYLLGYNTANDWIKVKQIAFSGGVYQNADNVFAYPFSDLMKSNLASVFGSAAYSYRKLAELNLIGRYDGYSSFIASDRWLLTPTVGAKLNFHELLGNRDVISTLRFAGSWGIFGKMLLDNRFKMGTQYRVDLGYSGEPTLGGYGGFSGLSKPYSQGWVDNFYNWPFAEKLDLGLDFGFWNDALLIQTSYYSNNDKNMVVPLPVFSESGFTYRFMQGMAVSNQGINIDAVAELFKNSRNFRWILFGNFSTNTNKLTKLPYGSNDIVYENKKYEIGKPIDSYWLYENKGIIKAATDIPVGKTNADGSVSPLSYSGIISFNVGDALWTDVNKDGTINSSDKKLMGRSLPPYYGGFGSNISYRNLSLAFQFNYAYGHQLLNQSASVKLDFINAELSKDIDYIKEVTFWQKTFDYYNYPLYNPWSSTYPYRLDQDLFLENAGYLKSKYISLGYDFSRTGLIRAGKFSKALLYVTASNLFTITKFKGGDPEQLTYMGVFDGRNLPAPKTYTIGINLNF